MFVTSTITCTFLLLQWVGEWFVKDWKFLILLKLMIITDISLETISRYETFLQSEKSFKAMGGWGRPLYGFTVWFYHHYYNNKHHLSQYEGNNVDLHYFISLQLFLFIFLHLLEPFKPAMSKKLTVQAVTIVTSPTSSCVHLESLFNTCMQRWFCLFCDDIHSCPTTVWPYCPV